MKPVYLSLLLLLTLACKKDKPSDTKLTSDTFLVNAGGRESDLLSDMFVGSDGNTWLAGYVSTHWLNDTIQFGNTLVKGVASDDIAFARYDKHGNVIWANVIGSSSGWDHAEAIVADNSNNCYVTGVFGDKTNFGNVELTPEASRNSSNMPNLMDMFLAKYDPQGKLVWVKQVQGAGYERPVSILVDKAGNIIVTGYYYTTIKFESTVFTAPGPALFLAKYSNSGNLIWVKSIGNNMVGDLYPAEIKLDRNENIIMTGSYSNTQNFGGVTLPTYGEQDVFTAKFDNNGNVIWAKSFGGPAYDIGYTMALDQSDNIYLGGLFKKTVTVGNLTITNTSRASDAFFAKLDVNGNMQWLKSASGDEEEGVQDMYVHNDSLYSLGYFTQNLTLEHHAVLNPVGWNGFVARHSLDGKLGGFQNFSLNGGVPRKIYLDAAGYTYIGGYFNYGININGQSKTTFGGFDMFLMKSKLALRP